MSLLPSWRLKMVNISCGKCKGLQSWRPLNERMLLYVDRDSGNSLIWLVVFGLIQNVFTPLQLGRWNMKKHCRASGYFFALKILIFHFQPKSKLWRWPSLVVMGEYSNWEVQTLVPEMRRKIMLQFNAKWKEC